jgi:hypothetical protein
MKGREELVNVVLGRGGGSGFVVRRWSVRMGVMARLINSRAIIFLLKIINYLRIL